jgi:TfoX/Sxy family transcriptional regulator of competence genes
VNANVEPTEEAMAFDEDLVSRIRTVLSRQPGITERRMFGGVAFLRNGLMFVGVSGNTLMARVGKANHEDSLGRKHVRVMDFTGKPMAGYVFVDPAGTSTHDELSFWVNCSASFVATLPPKDAKPRKSAPRKAKRAG